MCAPALFLQIRGFVRTLVTLITKYNADVSFLNWRFEVLCEWRVEVWDYHVVAVCFLRQTRFLLPISDSKGKEGKGRKFKKGGMSPDPKVLSVVLADEVNHCIVDKIFKKRTYNMGGFLNRETRLHVKIPSHIMASFI